MMLVLKTFVVLSFSLAAWASIPATSSLGKKPGTAEEIVPGKILVRTVKLQEYLQNLGTDEVVEQRDSQGGNSPDIFLVFKKSDDGSKQLIMQLLDVNRDGKVDHVKHYEKGRLVKEEKDTNYDGITDVVIEYDKQTGVKKKKSQGNNLTNIWTYYSNGEIYRKEVDRNFDGKPDMWVYFKNKKAYRVEVDQHFDGKKIVKIDGPVNLAD